MVFSTLHTNDAPGTITRLRDMGVEPFLITATVEAILAQRLVRKICDDCQTEFEPEPASMLMELDLTPGGGAGARSSSTARAATSATTLGYKGRMGIYELLVMNDDLRDMIVRGASHRRVPRRLPQARACGRLREAGLQAHLRRA